MSDSDTWAVLVAGEYRDSNLGGHTSVIPIAVAYSCLRKSIPRERIIVIAQVKECVEWHEKPEEEKIVGITDEKRRALHIEMWKEKKVNFMAHMAPLLQEGGADYDGRAVNPDTLLRVLIGLQSEQYPKVIQYVPHRTRVFFAMFGHGNWNGVRDNHYFYFPYPSPTLQDIMTKTERPHLLSNTPPSAPPSPAVVVSPSVPYDFKPSYSFDDPEIAQLSDEHFKSLSFPPGLNSEIEDPLYQNINSYLPPDVYLDAESIAAGRESILRDYCRPFRVLMCRSTEKTKPLSKEKMDSDDACCLHWQTLFQALRVVHTTQFPQAVFFFQQSCGSGGMWRWLKGSEAYNVCYGVNEWPLFAAYTAEPETSAVGSVWAVFFNLLELLLENSVHIEGDESSSVGLKKTRNDAALIRNIYEYHVNTAYQYPQPSKFVPSVFVRPGQYATAPACPDELLSAELHSCCEHHHDDSHSVHPEHCDHSHHHTHQELEQSAQIDKVFPHAIPSFYEAVARNYYRNEQSIIQVNYRMSSDERKEHGYQRFGVLGTACGDPFLRGPLVELPVEDFFGLNLS